jgi:hypothetical protein
MRLSFIVTTYNIEPYIAQCLDSLRPCVRPGDEVIVIDDGSTDTTPDIVTGFAAEGLGPDVPVRPILLGANTWGGVGTPANLAMDEATGDGIFFVDGDDWLVPEGFLAARRVFETTGPDILIGNYLEHDQGNGRQKQPADQLRWAELPRLRDDAARRDLALAMIAVPWRKFYRAGFLRENAIRFPEGRFFFEDNPFHWEVCRKAGRVGFADAVLCLHRMNRPGQTMASTGTELMAFFTHFATIRAGLPASDDALQVRAVLWLVNNMAWHIPRLAASALWPYAQRAAAVLATVPERLWSADVLPQFEMTSIGPTADQLRRGHVAAVVASWQAERVQRTLGGVTRDLTALQRDLGGLARLVGRQSLSDQMRAQANRVIESVHPLKFIAEHAALRALIGDPPADPAPAAHDPPLPFPQILPDPPAAQDDPDAPGEGDALLSAAVPAGGPEPAAGQTA